MGNKLERTALDFALEKTAGMGSGYMGARDYFKNTEIGGVNLANAKMEGLNKGVSTAAKALLVGYGLKMAVQKLMNKRENLAMVEDLMLTDPIIKQADPQRVKEFYTTIDYMAPAISKDKNVVKELLQNFIKFDRVDMPSIKALADTQKSLTQVSGSMASTALGVFK